MTQATRKSTRPGKSVMDCVKEFIAGTNTPFTLSEVCNAYTDVPKPQLATALWKLRGAGVVHKDDQTGVFTVLTGVNAPAPKPKAKPKAKAKAKPTSPNEETTKLEAYYRDQHRRAGEALSNLRQQHEDALAIIRYLENKLYVALQQVVKNG